MCERKQWLLVGEEHHLRERQVVGVRDGQERRTGADRSESPAGAAVKQQLRRSATSHHFDVPPQDALRVTGAECLHRRFLCCEPAGEVNGRLTPSCTVGHFAFGEYPVHEAGAEAVQGGDDSWNVGRVDSEADDLSHASPEMILPTPAPHFQWIRTGGGAALVCQPLELIAPHLFTTRSWALGARSATPPDDAWGGVAEALAVAEEHVIRINQVHGAGIGVARAGAPIATDADIALCNEPGLAVAIRVADCVPVLLADRRTGAIAAAHAGWRGLAARVPEVTVAAMEREFGSRPSHLIAAVGPSIGACCYEVRSDVRDRFVAERFSVADLDQWFSVSPRALSRNPSLPNLAEEPAAGRWFFDGWGAARSQLARAGVPPDQIFVAETCTASHPEVFCSYRRDGKDAGRLAAAIKRGPFRP